MNFITVDDLKLYQRKYTEDEKTDALVKTFCDSGMEAVKSYLGYDPELQEYTEEKYGMDGLRLSLSAPVSEILSLSAGGEEQDLSLFYFCENYIKHKGRNLFRSDTLYTVSYTGGFEEVPAKIKTAALQVASLYWESAGGNLAVSSTSFADTGSRVFNNFQAGRFLAEIQDYRILRI